MVNWSKAVSGLVETTVRFEIYFEPNSDSFVDKFGIVCGEKKRHG